MNKLITRLVAAVLLSAVTVGATVFASNAKMGEGPTVMRVGSSKISQREFAANLAGMMGMIENMMGAVDWQDEQMLQTIAMFTGGDPRTAAEDSMISYYVLVEKAKELGVPSQKELDDYYNEQRAMIVEQQGGEEKVQQILKQNGMTEGDLRLSVTIQKIAEALNDYYYGENGIEKPDEAEVQKYFSENYIAAKHILIATKDSMTGEDKRTLDEAKAIAEQAAARAKAGESFDALVAELGEDPGMQGNPEGYIFTEGEMVEPFYEGAKALGINEISAPIQTDYGYHVILRVPLDTQGKLEDYRAAVQQAMGLNFNNKVEQWTKEIKVERLPALEKVTFENARKLAGIEEPAPQAVEENTTQTAEVPELEDAPAEDGQTEADAPAA